MKQIKHPMFENELVKTPVILLIQTQSKEDSLAMWQETVKLHGAITASIYSSNKMVGNY